MTMNINTININLTSVTSDEPETNVPCNGCSLCCQLFSPYLTPEEVSSGKYPISLVNPKPEQLEKNPELGPIVVMFKNKNGGCSMWKDGQCTIYEDRPKACRQFDCRTVDHPKMKEVVKEKFGINK